ncbi:GNAT family N-acetyltransferase [Streptomyces sp. NPDC090080]|uniref:GNAT family N-acetyltransferase n=1 Tax=Streptomyces sp. NPDC090080 TaxID=3365939 RepID=UPI003817A8CA
MPPTDASADAGPVPVHPVPPAHSDPSARSGPAEDTRDCEDTLDLRLPADLLALLSQKATAPDQGSGDLPAPAAPGRAAAPAHDRAATLDDDRSAVPGHDRSAVPGHNRPVAVHDQLGPLDTLDLLDQPAGWAPTETPVGTFRLVPVDIARDLPVISRWMNDPAVAAFWQLAGSSARTEDHLRAQLAGDGRSVPCLGSLDGTPMSYWEIYRADLDPLARHYPARPHDTGLHVLIGEAADRGRGLGSVLLRAVADLVLDHRPACARVVAEPDLRNTPSLAAFLGAGFRYAAELDLPAKRAALMIRDRPLRHLM